MKSKILVVALIGVLMMTGLVLSCKENKACCTAADFEKWSNALTEEYGSSAGSTATPEQLASVGVTQCCIDQWDKDDPGCCKSAYDEIIGGLGL